MKWRVIVRGAASSSTQDFRRKADALHFIGYVASSRGSVSVTLINLKGGAS